MWPAWLRTLPAQAPWRRILLCGLWFFLIFVAYYGLKSLRDALASPFADQLNRLYLATFLATLTTSAGYSFLVSHTSRRRLIFWATQAFVACLLVFLTWRQSMTSTTSWYPAVFFVWVSVFNLFVVAIFWSVMADICSAEEGKLWFGLSAAFGTCGSITGSFVAWYLSAYPHWLFILSILCLEATLIISWWLHRRPTAHHPQPNRNGDEAEREIGGSLLAGLKRVATSPLLLTLCLYVVLGKFAATFIYNNLQVVVQAEMPELTQRLAMFSTMNAWTQGGTLLLQGVCVGLIMKFAGVGAALMIPCVVLIGLLLGLGYDASLQFLVLAQVIQQIVGYGLMTPAQHVLFTVVPREDKFQAKGFIDTVIFRFSDVAASNVTRWMGLLHQSLSRLAIALIPLMLLWLVLAVWLGREHRRRTEAQEKTIC